MPKLRFVKYKTAITTKGGTKEFTIKLPNDAKKIKGVWVTNDVDALQFPSAVAYVPPAVVIVPSADSGVTVVETWFYAITNGTGYNKWDRISRTNTKIYDGNSLVSDVDVWYNLKSNTVLGTAPNLDNLAHHTEPEEKYEVLVDNQFITLTNVKQDYPFGLIIPAVYKYVIVSFEANSATASTDLKKIARLGITADLVASLGVPFGDTGSAYLSQSELESISMIGLQPLNHIIQLQFIN